MLVGIVACALHFAYEYSVLQLVTFTVTPSRSTAMLPYRHRQILSLFQGNVVAVSLSGALPPPESRPSIFSSGLGASPLEYVLQSQFRAAGCRWRMRAPTRMR